MTSTGKIQAVELKDKEQAGHDVQERMIRKERFGSFTEFSLPDCAAELAVTRRDQGVS